MAVPVARAMKGKGRRSKKKAGPGETPRWGQERQGATAILDTRYRSQGLASHLPLAPPHLPAALARFPKLPLHSHQN